MKKFLLVVLGLFAAFVGFGAYLDYTTPEAEKQARREQQKVEREAQAKADAAERKTKEDAEAAVTAEVKARIKQAVDATDEIGGGSYSWARKNDLLILTLEIPESDAYKARLIGTKLVVAVRNQFYQRGLEGFEVENYRVTVNGPSPGPDMIARYGSARLFGGKLDWEVGSRF